MRIALLCATQRGARVLEALAKLAPDAQLDVFSFPEEAVEPPFLDTIRDLTVQRGGTFHRARTLDVDRWRESFDSFDLLLAVNWRYMLPAALYQRVRLGAFAFHDSLLPAYRGFSPTVWAIVNGEDHTGATLFHMSDEVDAGDVVAQLRVPIGPDEPIGMVMERVTDAYLDLLTANLGALLAGVAPRTPQDHELATYACKRTPPDNDIDWGAPTNRIHDLIRGVSAPYPGATTWLEGRRMRVWAAVRPSDARHYVGRVPGRVVEVRPGIGSIVLTGDGSLLVTEAAFEGERPRRADEVLNRLSLTLGRGSPAAP